MERTAITAHRWRLILFALGGILAAVLLRRVLQMLAMQLLAAALLMLIALPLCRSLEKKLSSGAAAALSLALILVGAVLTLMLLIPPAAAQIRALADSLPALAEDLRSLITRLTAWLDGKGVSLLPLRDSLFTRLTEAAGSLFARGMGMITGFIGSLSKVLLSPLMAFYLLRDRRRISLWLTLLLPVKHRARGVRAAREMKRETTAYLRGQLLLSLSVGGMTAAALGIIGVPGWLLLGVLMGVLELVPYIGPLLAGIPAVLLALPGGWARALWTLAALLLVQETEGALLSPRLVGNATALHPLTVLLLVSAGGILGGALGMVLVIPAVVSVRGAVRGWRE